MGRKLETTPRMCSATIKEALLFGILTLRKSWKLILLVGKSTICSALPQSRYFWNEMAQICPKLFPEHVSTRMKWARKHVQDTDYLRYTTIFSNKEKYNLEHPDWLSSYWHDPRHEKRIRISFPVGGGSAMIWGSFSWHGKPILAILSKLQTEKTIFKHWMIIQIRLLRQTWIKIKFLTFSRKMHPFTLLSWHKICYVFRFLYHVLTCTVPWF